MRIAFTLSRLEDPSPSQILHWMKEKELREALGMGIAFRSQNSRLHTSLPYVASLHASSCARYNPIIHVRPGIS
jgi:hypothetical protein